MALKKILGSGKEKIGSLYDEGTVKVIEGMDKVMENILIGISNLKDVLEAFDVNHKDYKMLENYLNEIIELQLTPILEHFS